MITLQQYLNENLDINEGISDSIKGIIKRVEAKIKKLDYKSIISKFAVSTALAASLLNPMKIHAEKLPYNSWDYPNINAYIAKNDKADGERYAYSAFGEDNEDAVRNAFALLHMNIFGTNSNYGASPNMSRDSRYNAIKDKKDLVDDYKLNETADGKIVCTLFLTKKAAIMTEMPGLYKISNGKVKNLVDNEKLVNDKNYKYYRDYESDEIAQMCKDAIDDYREKTDEDCEAIAGVMSREIQSARNFSHLAFTKLIKSTSSNIVKNAYTKKLDNVTMQLSNGKYVDIILVKPGTLKTLR